MNLSFAIISTSILLGAAAGTSAEEDGSSILRGAISSSTHNTAAAIIIGDDAAAQNLRRSYRQSCDMYTPCPYGKFCKMDDGMCLASIPSSSSSSAAAAAEADESSEDASALLVDTSPPISGVCKRTPSISVCTGDDPEVCGCDGNTYYCREDAYYNGVNVDYVDSCSGSGSSQSSEGRYIVNAGSPNKRAITIAGGGSSSCAPGANIQLFHQVNGDHQKWIYHYDTGLIESVACPGMVLNIDGGRNSNCAAETNIILWDESGVEWEKWMYSPDGKLISMYCDNMVIDIYNGSDSNGANIQLFSDTGSDSWNQKWNFE